MTAVHISRHRQARYLHDDGQGQIWMTGDIAMTRCGGEPDNLIYVDVDGGPMISVGENLKEMFKDDKDRIVEKLEVNGVIKIWYKINNKI